MVIALPIVGAFLYVHRFGINFPYSDQWVEVDLFGKLYAGTLGVDDLFALHNEHRLFFPRLVILSLAALTHYNTVAEMYLIQVLAVATLIVLWLSFRAGIAYKVLAFIPVAFLLFSLRQHVSMLLGIQIVVAMAQFCAVFAFYCLYRAGKEGGGKIALPLAILSATVASFSFLQGLFVWPAGLVQLFIMHRERLVRRRMVLVWLVAGICEWVLYFRGFANEDDRALGYFLIHPLQAAQYLLTFAGSTLFAQQSQAFAAGIALLVLAVVVVVWLIKDGALGGYSFWIAVLVFAGCFAFAAMVGRLELGVQQATASRYVSLSILLPISLYAILVQRTVEKGTVAALALAAFVVMMVVSIPGAYSQALEEGARAKHDRGELAFVLATYRSQPAEVVASLSPAFRVAKDEGEAQIERVAASAKKTASLLDRLDYTVFAPGAQPSPPPAPAKLDAARGSTRAVVSRIDRVRAKKSEGPVTVSPQAPLVTVTGWAVDKRARRSAGGVYVVVNDRKYPAYYGTSSENVEKVFGVADYANAGFEADIPVSELKAGVNEISLLVVTSDSAAYYKLTGKAAVKVNR